MWTHSRYHTLVRASGLYDLTITLGFATPWTFMLLHGWLGSLHTALGLPGQLPAFGPEPMMMANLMGSIVCVWAWLRIRHPSVRLGRYDAVGRVLFASWQLYALAHGATALIWGIVALEIAWAIAQGLPISGRDESPIVVGH
ncbi:hypothetical protein IAE35_13795 [Pseudomonas sp. S75]|uniref:hypothetical protein n=1 Tax=unclassified Pseudomonas TaxID=196821 RepID=UPI001906DD43|nr:MULTISPECIES: hypothetical protein [unclassified Pseudomonas]MBJ9976601.1 hypothetical protein [Pseudomonas sp. S30]MBK0154417.1 hypothetical protein [Pseudomonas sp. S75]